MIGGLDGSGGGGGGEGPSVASRLEEMSHVFVTYLYPCHTSSLRNDIAACHHLFSAPCCMSLHLSI